MKKSPKSKEFKKHAMCVYLNIDFHKVHNLDHESIAFRMFNTKAHIDPLNICSKEDLKIIIQYMREDYKKIKIKENK